MTEVLNLNVLLDRKLGYRYYDFNSHSYSWPVGGALAALYCSSSPLKGRLRHR